MSKKEVVKADEVETAAALAADVDAWGPAPEVGSQDVTIPLLYPVSSQSKIWKELPKEDRDEGVWWSTHHQRVVGPPMDGMDVVPVVGKREWWVYKKGEAIGAPVDRVAINRGNERLPFNFNQDGVEYERQYVYQFSVLLVSDLEGFVPQSEDDFNSVLPHTTTFKVGSRGGGQTLYQQMYVVNRMSRLSPAARVFRLYQVEKVSKNTGKGYLSSQVKAARASTALEQQVALFWHKRLVSENLQVAQEDVFDNKVKTDY